MKKLISISVSFILIFTCFFTMSACSKGLDSTDLWENATYLNDETLGSGEKVLTVEVTAAEQTIVFTINTDKETVGDALLEHKLIEGEDGEYGMYIKKVNGITADYTIDQSYWAFYVDGQYATSGVDTTEITEGVTYKLEHTK